MPDFELIRRWTSGEEVTSPLLVSALRRVAGQLEGYGSRTIRTEPHHPYATSVVHDLRTEPPCPFTGAVSELFLESLRVLRPTRRTVDAVDWACTCGKHSIREVDSGAEHR